MRVNILQAAASLSATVLLSAFTTFSHAEQEVDVFTVEVEKQQLIEIAEMQDLSRKIMAVATDFAKWSLSHNQEDLSAAERKALLDQFSFEKSGMSLEELSSAYESVSEKVLSRN